MSVTDQLLFFQWTESWQRDHRQAMEAFDQEENLRPIGQYLLSILRDIREFDLNVALRGGLSCEMVKDLAEGLHRHFERLTSRWDVARAKNPRMDEIPVEWREALDFLTASLADNDSWLASRDCMGELDRALRADASDLEDCP